MLAKQTASSWVWIPTAAKAFGCPGFVRGHLVVDDALAVPRPAALGEVVDGGKLDEGGEDEGVADGDEPVHGGGVGHLGQRVTRADAEGGHR